MSTVKVRRGDSEFEASSFAELRQWVTAGRVAPSDYVYNETLGKWMYAREMEELKSLFPAAKNANTLVTIGAVVLAIGIFIPFLKGGCGLIAIGALCLVIGLVRRK